jgi:DNA polymerase I-like protein with 3'-5' exonuclease and polymerase domains
VEQRIVAKGDKKWGAWISKAPGSLVGKYAIGDVVRTKRLFDKYYDEVVRKRSMGEAYDRERRLMPILLKSEQRGVRVDLRGLERDVPRYESVVLTTDEWIRKRLRCKDLNVDSNDELALAIQRAGVADSSRWARTETGQLSTAKDALNEALTDRALAGALGYRGAVSTCVRTFMHPWLLTAESSKGLIYTSWNQVRQDYHSGGFNKGARTARLQSTPNFQNIPTKLDEKVELVEGLRAMSRIGALRELLAQHPIPQVRGYMVPSRGMVLLNRDINQQELRILAHYESGELQAAYQRDPWLDMHTFVQTVISDILNVHVDRKPIKVLNFGLIYGMGVGKLARGMDLTVQEAQKIKSAHGRGFPDLRELSKKLRERADRGEPIRTWGGREYFCEPPRKVNGVEREFAYKLLNRLIQGSAADSTKQAMINYAERTREGYLLLSVHDELLSECPRGERVAEMRLLREAIADVAFDVPMLSTGSWSATRWTEMTELPQGE